MSVRRHVQFLMERLESISPQDYSTYAQKVYALLVMMEVSQATDVKKIIDGVSDVCKVPLHMLDYMVNPTRASVVENFSQLVSGIPCTDGSSVDLTVLEINNLLFQCSVRINCLFVEAVRTERFVMSGQKVVREVSDVDVLFDGKPNDYWGASP